MCTFFKLDAEVSPPPSQPHHMSHKPLFAMLKEQHGSPHVALASPPPPVVVVDALSAGEEEETPDETEVDTLELLLDDFDTDPSAEVPPLDPAAAAAAAEEEAVVIDDHVEDDTSIVGSATKPDIVSPPPPPSPPASLPASTPTDEVFVVVPLNIM